MWEAIQEKFCGRMGSVGRYNRNTFDTFRMLPKNIILKMSHLPGDSLCLQSRGISLVFLNCTHQADIERDDGLVMDGMVACVL